MADIMRAKPACPSTPPLNSTLSIARLVGKGREGKWLMSAATVTPRIVTTRFFRTPPHPFGLCLRCARLVVGQVRAPFLTPHRMTVLAIWARIAFEPSGGCSLPFSVEGVGRYSHGANFA